MRLLTPLHGELGVMTKPGPTKPETTKPLHSDIDLGLGNKFKVRVNIRIIN